MGQSSKQSLHIEFGKQRQIEKWKMFCVSSFPEVHFVWSALQEVLVRRWVGGLVGRVSL